MGRYGMAGDHYRQSGYVTLQDVPDPNREYVESFDNLVGGMNRFDLDYALKGNESPFMQNMSWHNGTLTSRLGQVLKWQLFNSLDDASEEVTAVAPFLFHGWWMYQHREGISAVKIQSNGTENEYDPGFTMPVYIASLNDVPGQFVKYRDSVVFKARHVYLRFSYNSNADQIEWATGISSEPYVPIIQMNTDPATGAGDSYQQENRLTNFKRVVFNVPTADCWRYQLPVGGVNENGLVAYVGEDPAARTTYAINFELSELSEGVIALDQAPEINAKLTIQFSSGDTDAYDSLMDCSVMAVFGGTQDLCIVLAAPRSQLNAYFWSGNNGIAMDPTYFPMNQYNLVGDNDDPITAMAKQQNMLVIFQGNTTGRAVFGTEKINDLETVTMNYTRINAEIGCDLPGSLQLVENNLVWCNRRYGVCRLKDSSAAYENNITVLSRKINGDYRIDGLLKELAAVKDDQVCSVDTGKRYILVLGDDDGRAYEWNYELSEHSNPSWFFHKNIRGMGFLPLANDELYECAFNRVFAFEPVFKDFEESAIEKIYRFPPRDFGGYDRLKNIKSILVTTRSDAPTNTVLKYVCDYKERTDPTNLVVNPNERNFAVVFRRKPGFHNMHHLGIEMSNNTAGEDLNLLSAKIFYEYRGRQK